jgi:glycosyltransferase involved in cell wall biosynthesis
MLARRHRALYAAFDRFPSRKGAAIHIDRFARTLFDELDGGCLCVLGAPGLPMQQVEEQIEIRRLALDTPNFLERAIVFGRELAGIVDSLADSLEICHFRDPWSGAAIALRGERPYATVYEVNALPSIELPSHFPAVAPRTLEKIRRTELACCDAADLIVTPSHTTAALLQELGVAHSKIRVIPNGADLDAELDRPAHAPAQYLLYFGSPQAWQGIDTLLRAFAALRDFPALRLVICASHRSAAWRPYERLATKLGIDDRLVWNFALEAAEMTAWRQHATISVAPLTNSPRNVLQGCAPLKIVESMASGTPIVASDVPPVRELIVNREHGWLVHPERPGELSRALRILLEHPDVARQMADRARQRVEEQFTWTASLHSLRLEYRKLLGARAAKGHSADESVADLPFAH